MQTLSDPIKGLKFEAEKLSPFFCETTAARFFDQEGSGEIQHQMGDAMAD